MFLIKFNESAILADFFIKNLKALTNKNKKDLLYQVGLFKIKIIKGIYRHLGDVYNPNIECSIIKSINIC